MLEMWVRMFEGPGSFDGRKERDMISSLFNEAGYAQTRAFSIIFSVLVIFTEKPLSLRKVSVFERL